MNLKTTPAVPLIQGTETFLKTTRPDRSDVLCNSTEVTITLMGVNVCFCFDSEEQK